MDNKGYMGNLHIEGAITFSYEAFRKHVNAWQNPSKPLPKKIRRHRQIRTMTKKMIQRNQTRKIVWVTRLQNTIQSQIKEDSTNVKNPHNSSRQGGVGKSLIAAVLAQYKNKQGPKSTLHRYRSGKRNLQRFQGIKRPAIANHGWRWNKLKKIWYLGGTDRAVYRWRHYRQRSQLVCAAIALLVKQPSTALLKDMGHELIVHTVITGTRQWMTP